MTERDDLQLERIIGYILRVGVTVSSLCLVAGLVLELIHVLPAVGGFLFEAGLVVLVATPIARVAAAFVTYLAERDLMFTALTAIVLVELGAAVVTALTKH